MCITNNEDSVNLKKKSVVKYNTSLKIKDPKLWTPNSPNEQLISRSAVYIGSELISPPQLLSLDQALEEMGIPPIT